MSEPSFWDKAKPILSAIAPTLATAFGGPVAGVAATFLSSALFGKTDASLDEIGASLATASPETLAKLKQIDADFKVKMEELGFNLAKMNKDYEIKMEELDVSRDEIAHRDRDSARQMQISTKEWIPGMLAFVLTIGLAAIIYTLLNKSIPAGNETIFNILTGSIASGWISMLSFYYGTSKSSRLKDQAISTALSTTTSDLAKLNGSKE